jgi:hypothetical protein
MRVTLRNLVHGSFSSFLDDGGYGNKLLALCVEGKSERLPARRGINLDPIICQSTSTSKSTIDLIQKTWLCGSETIRGNLLTDLNAMEFSSLGHLHPGGGDEVYSIKPELESFFVEKFESVVGSMNLYGFQTKLSRHDLFHGHMFRSSHVVTSSIDTATPQALLGILFHCSEYPMYVPTQKDDNEEEDEDDDDVRLDDDQNINKEDIVMAGIDLGFCQKGSDCQPSLGEWRYRNVLWSTWWPLDESSSPNDDDLPTLQQVMWLLDGASPEIAKLRMDGTPFGPHCPNTVFEDFLGTPLADIFFIDGNLYFTPRCHFLHSSCSVLA